PLPSKFDSAAGEVPLPGVPGHLSASCEAGKILGKKWQFSFRSIIIESSILFDGGRTMGIRIEIDAAPAYELYPSLLAYLGKDKSLGRGPSWARQVRKGLDKELAEDLKSLGKPVAFSEPKRKFSDNPLFQLIWLLPPLIRDCPEDRSVSGFLRWLEGLS